MKPMVVVLTVVAATIWYGPLWAAGAGSGNASATSAAPAAEKTPLQIAYGKKLDEIQKVLDGVPDQYDKLWDLKAKVMDKISALKDAKGKPVTATAMKTELAKSCPSAVAKRFSELKLQIIRGMAAIAGDSGPRGGAYEKCLDLEKIDPKDDDLKAKGEVLTLQVKNQYLGILKKIVPRCEAISDISDENGVYRWILEIAPTDPAATAYFKKKLSTK